MAGGGERTGSGSGRRLTVLGLVVLAAVLLAALGEVLARLSFPVLVEAGVWGETAGPGEPGGPGGRGGSDGLRRLRPHLRAWVDGAVLRTDGEGWRPGLENHGSPGQWRILVVGGRFTAAAGLSDAESFPAQMQAELRARWSARNAQVVAAAALGPPEDKTRWILEQAEAVDPGVVILEVEAADCGSDGALLSLPGEGHEPASRDAPSSMLLELLGWSHGARLREAEEEACADLVDRDGFFARAVEGARTWTLHWTDLGLRGDEAVQQRRLYNTVLSNRYGVARTQELASITNAYVHVFDLLKRRGIVVVVLPMDDAVLTEAIQQAARDLGVPALGGVPVHFDPELRVAGRPSRVCHTLTARCLLALLAELQVIDPDGVSSQERTDLDNLRSVTERLVAYRGELERAARSALPARVILEPATLGLLGGADAEGTILGSGPLELLVKPDLGAERLVLSLELPAEARAPEVRLRPAGLEDLVLPGLKASDAAASGRAVFSFEAPRAPLGFLSLLQIFPPEHCTPARFVSLTWE